MAINYAALKAEGVNDPLGLGYAVHFGTGNDQAIADLLNTPRQGATVNRTIVPAWEVVNAVVPAEYAALTATYRDYLTFVVSATEVQLGGGGVRDGLGAVFPAQSATRANLLALLTKQASRAEQLFGFGVTITPDDIAKARAA